MVLLETAATSMIRNEKTLESFNIETTDKRLSNLFSILYWKLGTGIMFKEILWFMRA